jgi:hypothetical protein
MNWEQIKNNWQKESDNQSPEIQVVEKVNLQNPLDKIKKNMKMEFLSSLFIFPLMFFVLYGIKDQQTKFFSLLLLLVAGLVTAYYYYKFNVFYKKIAQIDLKIFQNLLQLKYDLQLMTELYKSFYVSYIPILFCEIILIIYGKSISLEVDGNIFYFVIFASLFVGIVSLYLTFYTWFYLVYDKYIQQISQYIQQLQPDDVVENKNPSLVNRYSSTLDSTGNYFMKIFGKSLGNSANLFFWFTIICFLAWFLIVLFSKLVYFF